MGTVILRRDSGKGCLLKMDDTTRVEIEELGIEAWKQIEDQDPFPALLPQSLMLK
jgi:hypothetical protein